MDDTIEFMISCSGLTPAEAVDLYHVAYKDFTQEEWAEQRGVSQQAVSRNVRNGHYKITDEEPVVVSDDS
jgi:predicted DNA-binding protein (UPF0251 family)